MILTDAAKHANSRERLQMANFGKSYSHVYGEPVVSTAAGLVDALVNLGLLAKTESDGYPSLGFPDGCTLPEDRLSLSEYDLMALEERRNNMEVF